ncbi:ribose-5-phosphate isomerase [Tetragenococcus halophilus subsp. flandriensis]|uniref:RpiB/LacA/LacB family sugar-phosphate isomerase n=1 Tax=Tetragenococcus halophilus TaxID=51669 RepID=UPI0023E93FBB|nr:RpiB/LacA/LacB family sugar-phosphate isomerase [Tetragenococcus halophilus]GMA07794.1 ribose-5-phosphate isomerase [Tetragenococcus halophilus subsp. flandriensis]
MRTKIAVACDDVGFETKDKLVKYLVENKNAEIIYDPVKQKKDGKHTYAKLADEMAELIQRDECRLGIYICGTGIGFTCQANKHWGIRAVPVTDTYSARRARLSQNAQIIGLGCRVNGLESMEMVLDAWYDEAFDFQKARENSIRNLLIAEENDNKLLKKPYYIAWNMGFKEDITNNKGGN